ncbi:MAG: hypothetical protein HQL88_09840 [Magnetococcales bacterium]|nr:hypothetical protein [Magnetococcales bacterium]
MGNLAGIANSKVIGKNYSNRVVLYLESTEDLEVLQERWFRGWGEWIQFESVSMSVGGGGGGGAQVCQKVGTARQNRSCAFGIVDRDTLLNGRVAGNPRWEAFFETDHAAFDAARHLGEYVKVLRRWEMENYLLHPEAIRELIEDSVHPRSPCSPNATAQYLLDLSEEAIVLTAANLVLIAQGANSLSHQFGIQFSAVAHLLAAVLTHAQNTGSTVSVQDIQGQCSKIRNFLRDDTEDSEGQWNQLNHLIDGKIFLTRFCKRCGLKDPQQLRLARRIAELGLIDPEIQEFMEELRREAKLLA